MKIAYLDPVPLGAAPDFEKLIAEELKKYAAPGTEIGYHALDDGADNYEYAVYEAFMLPQVLKKVKSLEEQGYDGVILGCFYDPGIEAAKEFARGVVVVGVAEAAVTLANLLCKRFSLLIPRDKNYTHMHEMVERYNGLGRLASIRSLHIRVLDLQEGSDTDMRMEQEIEKAIKEDRAEAIVLACTMEAGKFKSLQEKYGLPVIDPCIAALKMAEYLIQCKKQCGWTVSEIGTYESPPEDELKAFGF